MRPVLKLTTPRMEGPAVKRLQELGDLIGFDRGPNDGIFGPHTRQAVIMLQSRFHLPQDGICGPRTWKAILDYIGANTVKYIGNDLLISDIRHTHKRPKLFGYVRPVDQIKGVTLHQTGCEMPSSAEGWSRLNAHIGVTQEGLIILVNNFTDMIWHAQGLSKFTIGIEFEGNFYGIKGRPATLWKPGGGPHSLTPEQVEASVRLRDFLSYWFDDNGAKWKTINAHRQSSGMRRADPGSEIWKQVAMPWAKHLGLKKWDGGEGYNLGTGKGIPREWNPRRKAKY